MTDNYQLKKDILKLLKERGELATYRISTLIDSYPKKTEKVLDEMLKEKLISKLELRSGSYWRLRNE